MNLKYHNDTMETMHQMLEIVQHFLSIFIDFMYRVWAKHATSVTCSGQDTTRIVQQNICKTHIISQ